MGGGGGGTALFLFVQKVVVVSLCKSTPLPPLNQRHTWMGVWSLGD